MSRARGIGAALAAACLLALAALPALARDLRLGWPVDCIPGDTCFVQNYRDSEPGPGVADFACGALSYDGHKGTDIALFDMAAMRAGVSVRAAAPGVVRALRDGEPDDGSVRAGKECGNGVLIDHGGGWVSQYCHMKRGSIAVRPGQRVAMGAPLGEVGYSGRTEFPHLHFELRRDGAVVDPFDRDGAPDCNAPGEDALWLEPVAHQPGGLVSAGMALGVPEFSAIKAGLASITSASPDAPALVVWAQAFGAREGDVLRLTIRAPDGRLLVSRDHVIPRNRARLFRATGKRRPAGGWAPGLYRGESLLLRDGVPLGAKLVRGIEVTR